MSDQTECKLCDDTGTVWYPQGGPHGVGARGKCPHLDGGKTSEKYRIAAGLRKATTKAEVLAVMGDKTRFAIDTIARWALRSAAESWMEAGWEDFPDFCEADYVRVTERMKELINPCPHPDEFSAAYRVLADRAGTTI